MLKFFKFENKYLLISLVISFIWLFPPLAYFVYACSNKLHIGTKKIIGFTVLFCAIAVIIYYGGINIKISNQKNIYEKIFLDNYIKIFFSKGTNVDSHEFWLNSYKVDRYETSTMQNNYSKEVFDEFIYRELESYGHSLYENINFEFSTKTSPLMLENGLTGVKDRMEIILQKNNYELLGFWNIIPLYFQFDNIPEKNADESYTATIVYKGYSTAVDNDGHIKKMKGEFVFKESSINYKGKIFFSKDPFIKE